MFEHQCNRLTQVCQTFLSRLALTISSGYFRAVPDVPWTVLLDYRGELVAHSYMLPPSPFTTSSPPSFLFPQPIPDLTTPGPRTPCYPGIQKDRMPDSTVPIWTDRAATNRANSQLSTGPRTRSGKLRRNPHSQFRKALKTRRLPAGNAQRKRDTLPPCPGWLRFFKRPDRNLQPPFDPPESVPPNRTPPLPRPLAHQFAT